MTIYYVRPDGNDANSGTGPTAANAWATWAKPIGKPIAAGDTIYFAPGTYRETAALATSGTNVAQISWIGDPYCVYFTDMNPGYVRLTGCDAGEAPLATSAVVSYGICAYNTIKNLVIDGNASNRTDITVNIGNYAGNIVENCIVFSAYCGVGGVSTNRPIIKNCLIVGGYYGLYECNSYNCISTAPVYAFVNGSAYDCIGFGSGDTSIFYEMTNTVNCLAVGGTYGFRTTKGTTTNSIAIGCNYGFSSRQDSGPISYCFSIACRYGVYGTSTASALNLDTFKYLYCYAIRRGSSYETGSPTAANHCGYANLYKILQLAHGLRFDLMNERDWSDDTVSWTGDTVDIIGQIRRLGDNTIDVGPLEYTRCDPEYSDIKTTTPAFKIYQKGEIIFPITVNVNKDYTISIWTKFALDGGSDKPVLAVSALDGCIAADSDTAAGDGSAYEQLSVTLSPTYTGTVQVKFQALENNANAYALFSDLTILMN